MTTRCRKTLASIAILSLERSLVSMVLSCTSVVAVNRKRFSHLLLDTWGDIWFPLAPRLQSCTSSSVVLADDSVHLEDVHLQMWIVILQ
jgi:hypothetical protein